MAERWVYFIRPVGQQGPVKIGVTASLEGRLRHYMSWSPMALEVVAAMPGGFDLESRLHGKFIDDHLHHEWFAGSVEMDRTIDEINRGCFDVSSLPQRPRPLSMSVDQYAKHLEWRSAAQRFAWMRKRGVEIPADLKDLRMWGLAPEERERRRALIMAFVASHPTPSQEAA